MCKILSVVFPSKQPAVAEGGAGDRRVDVRVLPAAHLLHVVRQVRLRLQHESGWWVGKGVC